MKFAEELFPLGTFRKQQTAGAYIDETASENLNIIAKKVADDMHFLGIISGHDMVGNGKTTIATQYGSYLTWKINQLHGVNNSFTADNMVFKGLDLASRSFKLPKFSVLVLDEGDDLTTHGMKDLAVKLKRYFRKCRQLNQILILIIPSFFELPKFFALSRSQFLIDVKFEGEFERGYFGFYGLNSKKKLYLKGKRDWNYDVQKPDFKGRFFGDYCFFPDCEQETKKYKDKKYRDMVDDSNDDEVTNPKQIRREITSELFRSCYQNLNGITLNKLAIAFGISTRTANRFLAEERAKIKGDDGNAGANATNNIKSYQDEDDDGGE